MVKAAPGEQQGPPVHAGLHAGLLRLGGGHAQHQAAGREDVSISHLLLKIRA